MAFHKKNKRKITVGEYVFYWTLQKQYPEDILRLTVMTEDKTHSRLICRFKYKDFWLYFSDILKGELKEDDLYDDELLKITKGTLTPWLVRQVVDYALKNGWKPFEKDKDFVITETEAKIDINFRTETISTTRRSQIPSPKSKI